MNRFLAQNQVKKILFLNCIALIKCNKIITVVFCTLFISTVNGQWIQMGPVDTSISTFGVVDNTIFAGSGNSIYSLSSNGLSWTKVASGGGDVIAANKTYVFVARTGKGIFRSLIDDTSYTPVVSGLSNTWVNALITVGNKIFAGFSGSGLYVSINNGDSWQKVPGMLANLSIQTLFEHNPIIIAGTSDSGVYISSDTGSSWLHSEKTLYARAFAVIGSDFFAADSSKGIYKSSDNGVSWIRQANIGLLNTHITALFAIGPNLFAGTDGGGVFISDNKGETWSVVNKGLSDTHVRTMAALGNNLFVGTEDGGVFQTSNDGQSWVTINSGLMTACIFCLTISDSTIFAGTMKGFFRSNDNGLSWFATNTGLTQKDVHAITICNNHIYAGTFCTNIGGVFISNDNGMSWVLSRDGLSYGPTVRGILVDEKFMLAGADGVYRSTDSGSSWDYSGLSEEYVNTFCRIDTSILAGVRWGGKVVYKSVTNGKSWIPSNIGMNTGVFSFLVKENYIFAGIYCFGVSLSVDSGASWEYRNNGIPLLNDVPSLAAVGSDIFAGTSSDGVYITNDNGNFWKAVNTGLPENLGIINALAVKDDYLFAGTSNLSVWRRPISEMTSIHGSKTSKSVAKRRIRFDSFGKSFSYTVQENRTVQLGIYTLSGKLVRYLVNRVQSPGEYKVAVPRHILSPGVYLYKFYNGNYQECNKIVMIGK